MSAAILVAYRMRDSLRLRFLAIGLSLFGVMKALALLIASSS